MASIKIEEVAGELFKLLKPLESAERRKVILATLTLLGDQFGEIGSHEEAVRQEPTGASAGPAPKVARQNAVSGTAQAFFDEKDPQTKVEEFAVAARFRELTSNAHTHEKGDLGDVIGQARRSFDSRNYRRDMDNAKKAGFFNRGPGNVLSHFGQKYVNALPEREVAKAIKRPKSAGRRRTTKKKALKK